MANKFIDWYNKLLKVAPIAKDLRQRGNDFEKLLREYFKEKDLLSKYQTKSFHTSDNRSEQIDGVVSFKERIFLIEVKWTKSTVAADLYAFSGKVENKFFGTLGIFISANELSINVINSMRKGKVQRIILIHGNDIPIILEDNFNMKGYLEYCLEKLSFDNLAYVPVDQYIKYLESNVEIDFSKALNFSSEAKALFDKYINDSSINEIKIISFIKLENEIYLKEIFVFIINKFEKIFNFILSKDKEHIYRNSIWFLENFEIENKGIKDFFIIYFEMYFSKNVYLYGRRSILHHFEKFYQDFKTNIKFHEILEKSWEISQKQTNNYDAENIITGILKQIWEDLSEDVKLFFEYEYIQLFYSSRSSNFPQMEFAYELVLQKKLRLNSATSWIEKKIIENIEDAKENDYIFDVEYFANGIIELSAIILGKVNEKEWINYVNKRYKEIST